MNFYQFNKLLKNTCDTHKLVNEFQNGDIYTNLNSGQHKYPCLNLTVQSLSDVNDSITNCNFTLFYVDRLLDNNANTIEVQSNGLTILKQIVASLEEGFNVSFKTKSYTPFTEKFADLCAGVYMTATIALESDVQCDSDVFNSKTITLTKNGIYDVFGYEQAIVNIEQAIVKWGTIDGDIQEQKDLQDEFATKQDKLTPGDNITIEGNVISAIDTIYDDSEIKNMIEDVTSDVNELIERVSGDEDRITSTEERIDALEDEIDSKQDKLTPGDNITIEGNVISATDTIYDDSEVKASIDDLSGEIETLTERVAGDEDRITSTEERINALESEVENKQDKLIAGDNISIEGNVISATDTIYDDREVRGMIGDLYDSKQDNLISGENIKTINGESILGSGDIEIQGGSKQRKIIVGNAICASGKRNPSKDTGRIKEDIEIYQHEGHSYFFYEHITFKRIPEDKFNRILDNVAFGIVDKVVPASSEGIYVGAITINVNEVFADDRHKSALIDIDEDNSLDVELYLTDKNYAISHTRRASKLNSKTASPNLEIYDGKIICVAKLNPKRQNKNVYFGKGKKLVYKECRFNNWIKRWKTVQVLKSYDNLHIKGARKDHIFNFKEAFKLFECNNARHNHILTIYRVCKGRKSIYGYKLSVYYSNKDGKVVRFIRPIGTC